MRPNDAKVQEVARELGMLIQKDGKETSTCLRTEEFEMSFDYQNPEEHAHITVTQNKKPWRTKAVYMEGELDANLIREEWVVFFKS
mgnify:CR=1 FL=1